MSDRRGRVSPELTQSARSESEGRGQGRSDLERGRRAGATYSSWSSVFWFGLSWLMRILRVGSIRCFLWGASRGLGRDTDSDRLCSSSGRRTYTSILLEGSRRMEVWKA